MSKLDDEKHDLNDFVSDYWNRHRTTLEDGNIELKLELSQKVSRDLSSEEASTDRNLLFSGAAARWGFIKVLHYFYSYFTVDVV